MVSKPNHVAKGIKETYGDAILSFNTKKKQYTIKKAWVKPRTVPLSPMKFHLECRLPHMDAEPDLILYNGELRRKSSNRHDP